jgi:hypothetical protein
VSVCRNDTRKFGLEKSLEVLEAMCFERSGTRGQESHHNGQWGVGPAITLLAQFGVRSLSIPIDRKWLKSSLEKLSEKGYRYLQRSTAAPFAGVLRFA